MKVVDLFKKLVEEDDKMGRMSLIEEYGDIVKEDEVEGGELDKLKNELDELKKKYIETFFSPKEEKEIDEKEVDKPKTLEDLGL